MPPAESMLGGHTKQELEICNRPGSCGPKRENSLQLTCLMSPQTLVIRGTQHTSGFLHKSFSRWSPKSQRICFTTQVKLCASIKAVSHSGMNKHMTLWLHTFVWACCKAVWCVPLEITKLRCDTVSKRSDSGMLCL